MTILTLSAGSAEQPLTIAEGYVVRRYEFQGGAPRGVATLAPNADGSIDTSSYAGAGAITIALRLPRSVTPFTSRWTAVKAFTHPRLRPTLTVDYEDGTPVVQATLSQGTATGGIEAPTHRDLVAQFVVPSGVLESAALHTSSVNASGDGTAGRTYDLVHDRTYPTTTPSGEVLVMNAGDRDAYPLLRLYGPWSGVTRIENRLTDQALVFDGESVTAGDFLEIDTRERTILLNGDPANNRYHRLSFPASAWWTLRPGAQRIRFVPTTFTVPANARIIWRDAYS